jgi:hypothetical protein
VRFDVLLDRCANVRHTRTRPYNVDSGEQRLFRYAQQRVGVGRHASDGERHCTVSEESIQLRTHIERKHVTLDETPR